MIPCTVIPSDDRVVSPLLAFLDCQAETLGTAGYQALAAPGSSVMLVISAMLAILIAILGYRMLFGETPALREGVLTFVKIGIVLAFATSWPAYRTIVYDVTLRAPADLAADIGGPAQIPGTTGGMAGRLDTADQAFRVLAIYGVGTPTREQVERSGGVAPPLFASFDAFALGSARIAFLIGSVGTFALIRLGAGLMLALGPLFLAFLLFDGTRGLFEGWARALVAFALGGVAIAIGLGIELALFEPWLADLVARREGGEAIPNAATSVFAASLVFLLVLLGLLALVVRVAAGFRLSAASIVRHANSDANVRSSDSRGPSNLTRDMMPQEARSRAMVVADHIADSQRREEQALGGMRSITIAGDRGGNVGAERGHVYAADTRLGQSFRRRTRGRVSSSAGVRDRMA